MSLTEADWHSARVILDTEIRAMADSGTLAPVCAVCGCRIYSKQVPVPLTGGTVGVWAHVPPGDGVAVPEDHVAVPK